MIRGSRRVAALGLLVLLVVYLRLLAPSLAPYAGSADSSGYLWSARLFRSGRLSQPIGAPAGFPVDAVGRGVFAPLGADVQPTTGELVPTYPTGFPLHLAAGQLLARDEERGTRAVLLVIAGVALWLCYRLGREAGLSRAWAAAGCATLGASPLFLFIAVQPMSDVLALAWAEAAMFFAWRARRAAAFAPAAGASLGVAALVRPTNLVLLAPVIVACPRRFRGVALGLLGPAAFLLAYQALVYGSPVRTGYGDVSSAFSLSYAGPSLRHYLAWIPSLASPIVAVAPGAWWAWAGELARWRAVALSWIVAIFGLYACYFHTAEHWWYLRFVLPAFPPLIVAGLLALQAAARWRRVGRPGERGSRVVPVAAAMAALVSLAAMTRGPSFDAHRSVRPQERLYRETVQWMALSGFTRGPVAAVQLSGALNYYAPSTPVLRHDRLSSAGWEAIRRWQGTSGQDVHAALFPFERESFFGEPSRPCDWEPRGAFRGVSFWRCAARSLGSDLEFRVRTAEGRSSH